MITRTILRLLGAVGLGLLGLSILAGDNGKWRVRARTNLLQPAFSGHR